MPGQTPALHSDRSRWAVVRCGPVGRAFIAGRCRRRYEDDVTNPGHPFACGLTLDSITGYTVDELGKEAFVTNNPLQMLRKVGLGLEGGGWRDGGGDVDGGWRDGGGGGGEAGLTGCTCVRCMPWIYVAPGSASLPAAGVGPLLLWRALLVMPCSRQSLDSVCSYMPLQALRLRRMALYFDTDAEFWSPPASWRQLAPHDWDDWFQPGIGWVAGLLFLPDMHREFSLL